MKMRPLSEAIGYTEYGSHAAEKDPELVQFINLKLAALDLPIYGDPEENPLLGMGKSLLATSKAKDRLLGDYLCPADQHIQEYLVRTFAANGLDTEGPWLPTRTFVLERHGLARALSLPPDRDDFRSDIIESYRTRHGVLHNPKNDRRTTKGVFHVAEGGLPVPWDKKEVPLVAFQGLLKSALNPPPELMELPFTDTQEEKARTWTSLLLRPLVCPEVPGVTREKRLEVRFFAPGNMIANLDFVESIFGNAGHPLLPENDARLDTESWSGHTGCVILAPQMLLCTKKDLGLPHVSEATERQKRDSMCWEKEDELYNDGGAFKITCRDRSGVIVTLIADNYFGYCKKEVKTQLSYSANLMGLVEEEHAGGAIAFPSFDLGEDFRLSYVDKYNEITFEDTKRLFGDRMVLQPEGYGVDTTYDNIFYLPENAWFDLRPQKISWSNADGEFSIKLRPKHTYVLPNGYKVEMVNPSAGQRWRLVGTQGDGIVCHKPCTVSGGGKSEISKPITDAMVNAPVFTPNFEEDMKLVKEILEKDYADRFAEPRVPGKPSRPILSPERSIGSVVRMLTMNPEYSPEYKAWLAKIPQRVRDLVLTVKRYHRQDWEENWMERFHVDTINEKPGFELRYRNRPVVNRYVRVGYAENGSWRLFSLRKDFWPASKLQREDDITASVVVPNADLPNLPDTQKGVASKFLENCEYRLFQRPDDAFIPGYDKQTEYEFTEQGNLFANYAPLKREDVQEMVDDVIRFSQYTEDMQEAMLDFLENEGPEYFVCTSNPRIVDGKPTKNPRFQQNRPDLGAEREEYLADAAARLARQLKEEEVLFNPVGAVLPGRRNNPPDVAAGIRPLAVFNPIHYQELPELFMDFVASLTGKSPSTTGAGSEGALTKAPFNALLPVSDMNNALLSFILCGHNGFTTAAGYVGHKYRVDHDISLLVPELWSRLRGEEYDPKWLIANGYLEKVEDFQHEGEHILGSRLGYRITESFARDIFGRIFSHPETVLTEEMLKPELQNLEYYVDGINNIVEAQRKAAMNYFEDGGVDQAIPPLKVLLHMMAYGNYEGKDLSDPELRKLFEPETILSSDWYADRLQAKLKLEKNFLTQRIIYLENSLNEQDSDDVAALDLRGRLTEVKEKLNGLESNPASFIESLKGSLGADPNLVA